MAGCCSLCRQYPIIFILISIHIVFMVETDAIIKTGVTRNGVCTSVTKGSCTLQRTTVKTYPRSRTGKRQNGSERHGMKAYELLNSFRLN